MKKIILIINCFILFLSATTVCIAQAPPFPIKQSLNKINYQIAMEQWVGSRSAKMTVGIDVVLQEGQLGQIRNEILQNLAKLTPSAAWHITSFDRSQDTSGLEKLHVEAQTRVSEELLSTARQQAKAATKPGQTYNIIEIDFTPSLAAVQQTQASVRNAIYAQVKSDLAAVNAVFPEQKYYLHRIDFYTSPPPLPVATKQTTMVAMAAPAAGGGISVSSNIMLYANVTLAANINNNASNTIATNVVAPVAK